MKSFIKYGSIAGIAMGVALFIGGAVLAGIIYGSQMAPEGKFEPDQMNPFYFIWTKLLIGVIFGILFTFVYEKLPLIKKHSGALQGIKYAVIFWIVMSLWNLSHPITYDSINYKDQIFWLLYTLCGFIGFGFSLGLLYKKRVISNS